MSIKYTINKLFILANNIYICSFRWMQFVYKKDFKYKYKIVNILVRSTNKFFLENNHVFMRLMKTLFSKGENYRVFCHFVIFVWCKDMTCFSWEHDEWRLSLVRRISFLEKTCFIHVLKYFCFVGYILYPLVYYATLNLYQMSVIFVEQIAFKT